MKLMASSPMKVQHDKRRPTTTQQVDLNDDSYLESFVGSPLQSDRHLANLHASYGSLNNSSGNFNTSASSLGNYYDAKDDSDDVFFSPQQHESPWGVKLKKKKLPQSLASNTLVFSPAQRLQKVDVGPGHKGDWADPSDSSLVQDLNPSSPKESPLRKRQTMKPPMPTSKPNLSHPVYSSPVVKKKKKSEGNVAADSAVANTPDPASKKKVKKITAPSSAAAPGMCATKPMPTTERKQRSTPQKYELNHHAAASTIASIARGQRDRLKAELRRLEQRLEMIKAATEADIATIAEQTKLDKNEFKKRANDRSLKNVGRKGQQEPQVEENQATIARLRKENSQVRAQNVQMAKDIAALRVNNERLNTSQEATEGCFNHLKYHDDTCEGENARLRSIKAKYEKAIEDHQEHLDLHNSHIAVEVKVKGRYRELLGNILKQLDQSKGNKTLRDEAYEMAEELDEFKHLDEGN
jgi:hypothetical protein